MTASLKRNFEEGFKLTASSFKVLVRTKRAFILSVARGITSISLISLYIYYGLHLTISQATSNSWDVHLNPDIVSFITLPVLVIVLTGATSFFQTAKTHAILNTLDGNRLPWKDLFNKQHIASAMNITLFKDKSGVTRKLLQSVFTLGIANFLYGSTFVYQIIVDSKHKRSASDILAEHAGLAHAAKD